MQRTRELNKQDSNYSTHAKNHHVEPTPNHNSCGGCNSCHQMTGIHSMTGSRVFGGSAGEEQGSNIQKSCATNFLQRNLGNSYMQNIAGDRQTSGSSSSWSGTPMIQKKCSCGGSCSGCSGEEELQRIQAKFSIGPTDDVYEKEADHVADKVLQKNIREQDIKNPVTIKPIPIQRRSNHSGLQTADLDLNKSNGRPMNQQVQGDMESRFGYSFKNVRIHNDAGADHLARSINSHAFTFGSDIYFGEGNYNPTSRDGKHLLAHELTHVIQQGHASADTPAAKGNLQRQEAGAGSSKEEEEDPEARREFEREEQVSEATAIQRKVRNDSTPTISSLNNKVIQRNGSCSPRITRRGAMGGSLNKGTFPSKVRGNFDVAASNTHLSIAINAVAKSWYLIWTSVGSVSFVMSIDVACERVGNKCEISPNERSGSVFAEQDAPASGAISVHTERRANNTVLAMTPRIGAAVGGGGSIGAGVGPASFGVSFPNSSQSRTLSLGTFLWSCNDSGATS